MMQLSDADVDVGPREAVPGLGPAMLLRVHFAGGEIPLWSLIAPIVIVAALAAAFAALAVSGAPAFSDAAAAPTASPSASVAPQPEALTKPPVENAAAPAGATAGPASTDPATDGPVQTFDLPPGTYSAKDVLGIASVRAAREVAAARAVQRSLDHDPGLAREPQTLAELKRFVDEAETARTALEAIAALPAPVAADLLYEVWAGTVQRNETTELARALLFSKDVRPKASPSLTVALELRGAEKCEDVAALLPRAEKDGDRRSLHLLIRFQRRYGCGPNKRQDCYPCLRSGDELESAIKAVRDRPEPPTFTRR
jgi:hypothetical protein